MHSVNLPIAFASKDEKKINPVVQFCRKVWKLLEKLPSMFESQIDLKNQILKLLLQATSSFIFFV